TSYRELGQLLEQEKRGEELAAIRGDALSLYAKISRKGLDPKGSPEVLHSMPWLLAAVLKSPHWREKTLQSYGEAVSISESLAAGSPQRSDYQFLAAFWHDALGSVLADTGQAKGAGAAYSQAVARYGAALEQNPNQMASLNGLAWLLATCPDVRYRDADRAVLLAKQATAQTQRAGYPWTTLGVAHYRAENWPAAVTALETALSLNAAAPDRAMGEAYSTFFLAMAHLQLGNHAEAQRRYDQAVSWMAQRQPQDEQLRRFRAEAMRLFDR